MLSRSSFLLLTRYCFNILDVFWGDQILNVDIYGDAMIGIVSCRSNCGMGLRPILGSGIRFWKVIAGTLKAIRFGLILLEMVSLFVFAPILWM